MCQRICRSEDSLRQYWVKSRGGRHLNGRRQKLTHFYQSVTRYTPKAWQTAGTVKTLIIYSTALSSLWMEQENFWWHQLFQELQNLEQFCRLFERNLSQSQKSGDVSRGKSALGFCPLHFASHHTVGLRGNEFLNGLTKYFCPYLKVKVIYVTLISSFGNSDDCGTHFELVECPVHFV